MTIIIYSNLTLLYVGIECDQNECYENGDDWQHYITLLQCYLRYLFVKRNFYHSVYII